MFITLYIKLMLKYRITAVLKDETDIIASIASSLIGRALIQVIMYVEIFKTDVIVFIGGVIICFTSDWPINLHLQVTNWPYIFVDQSQFSDPDFISGTHQRENVQFAMTKNISFIYSPVQSNLYIKATHFKETRKCGLYEQLPFIYRLELYALFINGINETSLCRQPFVI